MGFLFVFDVLKDPKQREQVVKDGRNKEAHRYGDHLRPNRSRPHLIANDGENRPFANEIDEGRASADHNEAENLKTQVLMLFLFVHARISYTLLISGKQKEFRRPEFL